jgi:ribonuclease T1
MLRSVKALWLELLGLLLLCLPVAVQADQYVRNGAAPAFVTQAELPPEARDTLRLIRRHGPFPYPRDDVVFGNYEHRLPRQPRGYYHEYTVRTPGMRSRGARRIVCGPLPECYYSGDHYRTFQRIRE